MGFADKWNWVATNITDGTLPKLEGLLVNLSQAVDSIAITSLIKQMESAISVIKGTSMVLFLFLVLIFVITILSFEPFIKHRTRTLRLNYVRFQYGDTVETRARTYANLIKLHSERVRRNGVGFGAERTNILIIGASETAEAYLRYDREFASDKILQSLLPQGQPFVFKTITDALHSLDVLCTSEDKFPKTLFVLLLISTRDPSLERQKHEAFQIPPSLRDHCYAILGTELGDNGVPAHKLSKDSRGPNGERLTENLPLGPKIAGVCFE